MHYLSLALLAPMIAAAQPPASTPPACAPVGGAPGSAGLGRAAGVYTLTLVGDSGARAVGTLFLRRPGADTLGAEGFRFADAGSVTVSLQPFGVRFGSDAPPGLPAWPLRLLVLERRVRDSAAATGAGSGGGFTAEARVVTVLGASEAPHLAPGQVARGDDVLGFSVEEVAAGRLRGRWRSPLLGWRGGYFCAERR